MQANFNATIIIIILSIQNGDNSELTNVNQTLVSENYNDKNALF